MTSIQLLSAVLAIQVQALSFGAPVQEQVDATQNALCRSFEELADSFDHTVTLSELPPPVAPEELVVVPPEDAPQSYWDPDPHAVRMEASRCRALLLEVIRRAAHDWVLYRNTRKPERQYALDAYIWLFEEEPGHPWWELREREGDTFCSFINMCELLDLDPEYVRARVRKMTIRDIATAGRPAEHRRPRTERTGIEDYSTPSHIDLAALEELESYASHEAYFSNN